MDKKKSPKRRSVRLKAEDIALWEQMTRDVKLLDGREYMGVQADEGDVEVVMEEISFAEVRPVSPVAGKSKIAAEKQGTDLDRRTYERLRKGQIRPEGRLDLHGLNQAQAHDALTGFIKRSSASGLRCVLVITGKGRPDDRGAAYEVAVGVLRQRVPEWLGNSDLKGAVLQVLSAQPKDGGAGAYYVYLRRNK
jgi:DNA-nicking Smr family endonuclease